jgi:hypothetical protein
VQCLLGSDRFFLRSHFYKAEPQGFPCTPSDSSGGYHLPKRSEELAKLLIRTGRGKALDEQYLPHVSSFILESYKDGHILIRSCRA